MIQDKDLLLKDLCARLPHNVKVSIPELQQDQTFTLIGVTQSYIIVEKDNGARFNVPLNIDFKPYLRTMSSMTEEELFEVQDIIGKGVEIHDSFISIIDSSINSFSYLELQAIFEWFNAHHFDYLGLIEKNLALDCTELHIYD